MFKTGKWDQSWKNNHIGRNITVTNNSYYGNDRHCMHDNTIIQDQLQDIRSKAKDHGHATHYQLAKDSNTETGITFRNLASPEVHSPISYKCFRSLIKIVLSNHKKWIKFSSSNYLQAAIKNLWS